MQQSLVASQAGAKVKSSEFQYLQKLFAGVVPPTPRQVARCSVEGVGNPASPECIRRLPLIAEQPLMSDTQVTTVTNRDYLERSTLLAVHFFPLYGPLYVDPRLR